jgi:aspartate kinase
MANQWVDAREWLMTDHRFRDARVEWASTKQAIQAIPAHALSITQGFIGHSIQGTTTLGREGSDYTAAIIAHCLDAESLVIWKDVPGMLNADPKKFSDAQFIPELSFQEALELAYYGASVIHPKTIQPLQAKNIPLYIQSFIEPENQGTLIHRSEMIDYPVCTILKENQTLLSITTKDGSFIVEDNVLEIFQELIHIGIKVQLMENSALSFSLCIQSEKDKLEEFCDKLKSRYVIKYNYPVTLVTLRHYQEKDLHQWEKEPILLEQKNRTTMRWILDK